MTILWHNSKSIASIGIVIVLLIACDEQSQVPGADPIPYALMPTNTLFQTKLYFFDSLNPKAHILAGRVRWYHDEQLSYLDSSVSVEFFSLSGRIVARLWCDSALIDARTNNMWAYGNVNVISDSTGVKLWTHSLHWNNTRRKLSTNDYVRIERPGELIEGGYGFESDEYLQNYTIFHIKGSVMP